MNIQQLYYFEAIARLKNYTKAAVELSTTQSCLSHSIADLEKELSISLFYRKGRNIDITDFGLSFLTHVNKILEELEAIKEEQQKTLAPFTGTLHIAFTANMSHEYIPGIIRAFNRNPQNHNIHFTFSELQATKKAIEDIHNGFLDIAFGAKVKNPDIDYYHIYDEELFLIVPKESPYAKEKQFCLENLQKETLITYNYNCGTRNFIDKLLHQYRITPRKFVEVETEKMIASAVSSGLGVAIMPIISELQNYNVSVLTLKELTMIRPLYMMWKKVEYPRPLLKNFINFIKSYSGSM